MSTGKFCWHDLMSTDPDVSQEFFTKLFGWTVTMIDMGPTFGNYRMLTNGEDSIGGIVPLEEGIPVPSHWIGYVMVDDVDAALERATNAGGRCCVPSTDIPNVGRFGVMTDPTGAVISPFKSIHEMSDEESESAPSVGSFCWNECLTNDLDAVKSFYGEVFGWSAVEHDMGEMGTYTMFKSGEHDRGGAMKMPDAAAGAPPHWLSYVLVDDVDAKTEEITSLGGTVHCGPMEVTGMGRFSVAADPTGATFAIWKNLKQG